MDTYELQVYQNGGWQFDSYYDSRDIVLSEAKKIDSGGRYLGVRVLQEKFNEDQQKSSYSTIFSRLKKNEEIGAPKTQAVRGNTGASGAAEKSSGDRPAAGRTSKKKKKSGGGVTWILMGGIAMVVLGIVAILALREYAGSV